MQAARHIFFDLDGTLTDSCAGIIRCVNHALAELGCAEETDDRLRGMIGQPLTAIFGAIMPAADDERVDRAIASYRVRFDDVGMLENALYPGVPEALQQLRESGRRLRVVTAKPAITAARVLSHFQIDRYFDAVHGPELTDRGCDKAALLGRALTEIGNGWLADACVMVGDRVDDMLAAKAHGVAAIGAGWGYGSRQELIDAGAMHVAADVGQLLAYLLE
ncbi:MAG: HAD hydrolase-like protein [Vicinamibacterales bacterium]